MMFSKSTIRSALFFAIVATTESASSAASILSLYNPTTGQASGTVTPGGSISVTLRVSTDQSFAGYSAFLEDPGFSNSDRFTITSRTLLATSPFNDPTRPSSVFASDPIDEKSEDLGYTGDAVVSGQYDLMTLTISTSQSLQNGLYSIAFDPGSRLVNPSFDPIPVTTIPYSLSVVPEPSSLGIVAITSSFLFRRRRSRPVRIA